MEKKLVNKLLEQGREIYNEKKGQLFGLASWIDNYSGTLEEKIYLNNVRGFFINKNRPGSIVYQWNDKVSEEILEKVH